MAVPSWKEKELQLIAPTTALVTVSAAANVDTDEANYAKIRVHLSSELNTDNTGVALSLLESDDTVVTNFATIVADQTVDNTNAGKHTYGVNLVGRKRYIRISVTPDTTTNGTVSYAADATLSRLDVGPASTSDMTDDTTNDTITLV